MKNKIVSQNEMDIKKIKKKSFILLTNHTLYDIICTSVEVDT